MKKMSLFAALFPVFLMVLSLSMIALFHRASASLFARETREIAPVPPDRQWCASRVRETLKGDLESVISVLKSLPPGVSCMGGSRITETDPCHDYAVDLGRLLRIYEVPVSTGGGRGIMEYVPMGFVTEKGAAPGEHGSFPPLREGIPPGARSSDLRTQAFGVSSHQVQTFNDYMQFLVVLRDISFRRMALFENKRGYVFFPGGLGTMDEFFEVWDLKNRGLSGDPVVFSCREYWTALMEALRKGCGTRAELIPPQEMSMVSSSLSDTPLEAVRHISDEKNPRGFDEEPDLLAEKISIDIDAAVEAYDAIPDAVEFMGGEKLPPDDPTLQIEEQVALALSRRHIPLRVTGGGPAADSVLKGAMKGSEKSSLQGVFLEKDTIPEGSFAPLLTLKSPLVHKNFTARKIKALVMLPPDVHALSELFGVACLMQNGVIDKKPIILVGRDFWMPLMETLQKLMLTGSRKLVGEEDFSLFTLSDDPEEIIRLICRAGSESQSPLSPLE